MENTFDLDGLGVDAGPDYGEHIASTQGQQDDEKRTGFFEDGFKSL
jgi:hypothetical protein